MPPDNGTNLLKKPFKSIKTVEVKHLRNEKY